MSVFMTSFPGTVDNVGRARHWVVDVLALATETVVPEEVIETAKLLVSECATNAVRYTHSSDTGQLFNLTVRVEPGTVAVEVKTRRPRDVLTRPRVCTPGPEDEHGRGLFLVQALATRWGPIPYAPGVAFTLEWPSPVTVTGR